MHTHTYFMHTHTQSLSHSLSPPPPPPLHKNLLEETQQWDHQDHTHHTFGVGILYS